MKTITKIQAIILALIISLGCQTVTRVVSPLSPTSPDVQNNRKTPLIGREPSEWFPARDNFALSSSAPIKGDYSYTNNQSADGDQNKLNALNDFGRIISFGHEWKNSDCSYFDGDMHYAVIGAILTKTPEGAQKLLDYYYQQDQASKEVISIDKNSIGDGGFLYVANYDSGCILSPVEIEILFRRYNVVGQVLVDVNLTQNSSAESTDWVNQMAKQIDDVITAEASQHPGTQAELESLSNTYMNSTATISDPGNPRDYLSGSLTCEVNVNDLGAGYQFDVTGTIKNSSQNAMVVTITTEGSSGGSGSSQFVLGPGESQNISNTIGLDMQGNSLSCGANAIAEWQQ